MEGHEGSLNVSIASFLSGFSYYMDVDQDAWAAAVEGMPLMHEVFIGYGDESIWRTRGTHLFIEHETGAMNPFNQSLKIFDILMQMGITRKSYIQSWQTITLGITVLDLKYGCPVVK
jgi:hypothetical protein